MTTEHTNRIVYRMVLMLTDYRDGRLNLRYLIDSLEGSLTSIEEKMPDDFLKGFYEHWGNLEQWLALGLEEERRQEILTEVKSLEKFLSNYVTANPSQNLP